jgi:predicted nucleotide-binding protein
MARAKIFISYSHKDRSWLGRLTEQLAVLQRRGLVDIWSDELIEVGGAWESAIEMALSGAKIAVLLISPSFLASEYIWRKEMPKIEAHADQGMEACL